MGHKDGTNNLRLEDPHTLDRELWAGDDDLPWMRGGTYLVVRRIRMLLEPWDRTSEQRQNEVIGRDRQSGAPLGASREHDPVELAARGADGHLAIPENANIRLAASSENGGAAAAARLLLRRRGRPQRLHSAPGKRRVRLPRGVGDTGWVGQTLFA